MLNPNRRINSSLAMSAAVTGIIAGVSLAAGCNGQGTKTGAKDDKAKEQNGCNSANGCQAS